MRIEQELDRLGLTLPAAMPPPPGLGVPFAWARVRGNRVYLSGHGPLSPDGSPAGPFGKVGADVSVEQSYQAARLTALALLASLKRTVGDLDRVQAWLVVSGFVNAVDGLGRTTTVLNGCSDLLLELYGQDIGAHARTAIGVAALPLNLPVIISAEVELG